MKGFKAISVLQEQIMKYDLLESTEKFSKLGKECGECRDELKLMLDYAIKHQKDIFNNGICFECGDSGFVIIGDEKYSCPSCNS